MWLTQRILDCLEPNIAVIIATARSQKEQAAVPTLILVCLVNPIHFSGVCGNATIMSSSLLPSPIARPRSSRRFTRSIAIVSSDVVSMHFSTSLFFVLTYHH